MYQSKLQLWQGRYHLPLRKVKGIFYSGFSGRGRGFLCFDNLVNSVYVNSWYSWSGEPVVPIALHLPDWWSSGSRRGHSPSGISVGNVLPDDIHSQPGMRRIKPIMNIQYDLAKLTASFLDVCGLEDDPFFISPPPDIVSQIIAIWKGTIRHRDSSFRSFCLSQSFMRASSHPLRSH